MLDWLDKDHLTATSTADTQNLSLAGIRIHPKIYFTSYVDFLSRGHFSRRLTMRFSEGIQMKLVLFRLAESLGQPLPDDRSFIQLEMLWYVEWFCAEQSSFRMKVNGTNQLWYLKMPGTPLHFTLKNTCKLILKYIYSLVTFSIFKQFPYLNIFLKCHELLKKKKDVFKNKLKTFKWMLKGPNSCFR